MTTGPAGNWFRVPSIEGVQARHASTLALGALVLLGLLLMHGFGGHAAHAAAPAAHESHAAAPAGTVDHPCSEGCVDVSAAPVPGQPSPGGGLVVLCAAVLLALTVLLLLGTAGQGRPAVMQPLRPHSCGPPPGSRFAVAAPDLHALSVLRC